MANRPNILLILNDDMGFSDLGCYGGEVQTPNLDRLAFHGLRFTQFYNTARCCPSRASLLTGLHPHQAGVGHMMDDLDIDGYVGDLAPNTATIAEALGAAGYNTYMSGKWHVTLHLDEKKHNWPLQRGFDRYYGIITGASSYYDVSTLTDGNERVESPRTGFYNITDDFSDHMVGFIEDHADEKADEPFFGYLAYTAPHWPLHAPEEDIAHYHGRFDAGWDMLRAQRLERMAEMGIIDSSWKLTPRDASQPPWADEPHKAWQARRMEVYAAQIERMDRGIGRVIDALERTGQLDNTLIVFLADNGGCAEEIEVPRGQYGGEYPWQPALTRDGRPVKAGNAPTIWPGAEDTYCSYGVPWANLSNTPFREYKHWVHEGGIGTPLIVHWPGGIAPAHSGKLRHQTGQLPDIMATFLDVAGADYPTERDGQAVQPCEGFSMQPTFDDGDPLRDVLYFEHEGNKCVRRGKWKLETKHPGDWELYDMELDRTELNDLSAQHPEIVAELSALYDAWAARCGVLPWLEVWDAYLSRSKYAGDEES
jgi:arylsulfatase A-like enzyme